MAAAAEHFTSTHEHHYGYTLEPDTIQVAAIRLRVIVPRQPVKRAFTYTGPPQSFSHRLYDMQNDVWSDGRLYIRETLGPGLCITGPAIVVETTATTLIPPNTEAMIDDHGTIVVNCF